MATNSSNITSPEPELGWQSISDNRATADILWNCICVILLITWTSFHPSVGTSWQERISTAITATLIPQLSALAASRDAIVAFRLRCAFKYWANRPEWTDGWDMTKSFLVVKGGIRAVSDANHGRQSPAISPPQSVDMDSDNSNEPEVDRRQSGESNSSQSVDITLSDINQPEANGRHSTDSTSVQSSDAGLDEIIDAETFLLLALAGRIRYEDFPTIEDINDKSNTDWFSKGITLSQLLWFLLSMAARILDRNCEASVLEIMVLNWVIFGLLGIAFWWKCPQNIKIPYAIQIDDSIMSLERSPRDRDIHADLAMGVLLGNLPREPTGPLGPIHPYRAASESHQDGLHEDDDGDDDETGFDEDYAAYRERVYRSYKPNSYRRMMSSWKLMAAPMLVQFAYSMSLGFVYRWHSLPPKVLWIIFTCFYLASEIVLMAADSGMRYDWGKVPISVYRRCASYNASRDWELESLEQQDEQNQEQNPEQQNPEHQNQEHQNQEHQNQEHQNQEHQNQEQPNGDRPPQSAGDRHGSQWLALARGTGIYNGADNEERAVRRKWQGQRLKFVMASGLVMLFCHIGQPIIALSAFQRAPYRIYNVPVAWLGQQLLPHVGA